MKRRFAAPALCAVLCALSFAPASAAVAPVNVRDDSIVRSRSTVVYCLSEDRYRLVPEVRSVTLLGNETLLDVLAEEVLQESESEDLVSALTGRTQIYVLSVSQTGNVATVDLGGDVDLMQEYDVFCLKAAMVNTLIESGGVEYVNVLFNGREVPTNGLPTGTMTRFDEDLQSAWVEHENEGVAALRSQSYSFRRNVTLYFPANDSNFLLAEVRELTRDEAIILMVESNLQRSVILPSEKAFSYKMRLEAMNRQGQRTDLTSVPVAQKSTSRELLGKEVGESQDQVRRYIRLTELIPELLDLVDEGRIAFRPAVELSYLQKDEQSVLLEQIAYVDATPSLAQAIKLKRFSQDGKLTNEVIESIMSEEKPNQREKINIKYAEARRFIPASIPYEKTGEYILKALEYYHRYQERQKSRNDAR